MGLRTIVLLLLAVGGLAAVLWLTDEKPKAKDSAALSVLDGRSLLQCLRMRWQFHKRAPIEIGRDAEGRFQLTEPIVDLASAAYMKNIVDTWDSANMRSTPLQDDAEGRQRAGLEEPELTFMAEFPDGVRCEVEIGAQGPLGETRFLRRSGKIWEGGDALVESMRVGLDDLRERTIYRHTPSQVNELRVEQASPTGKREALHLKLENREWRLLSPIVGRADGAAARHFLVAVLSQRADYFPPGLMRPPTDAPNIVVTVRGAYGEETVNLWTVAGGQLLGLLRGRNLYFTSDNRQYCAIFENAADHLRARILVPLGNDADSVYEHLAEVVIDPGQGRGDRLRFRRESATAEWRLVEPVEIRANPTACTDAAQAVNNLVVQEFLDDENGVRPRANDPRYGLLAGRLLVSVRGFQQQEATTLWFGGEVVRNDLMLAYACRADEPDNVVLVPKASVDHLRLPWTDYCERRVLVVTGIGRLDVKKKSGEQRTFRIEGEHWVLEGKAGERPEVGEFVTDHLRDLTGKRAVDQRGGVLGEADWTLTIARQDGDKLASLEVWERSGEAPLVVHSTNVEAAPVAFELGTLDSQSLRGLWQ